MKNEEFWKEHSDIYDFVKKSYLEYTYFELSEKAKQFFGISIDPEKIRWLCRDKQWKKRTVSPLVDSDDIQVALEYQKLLQKNENTTNEVTLKIKTDAEWISFIHSGDWHLEGLHTNLEKLTKDIETIATIPNLHLIFTGDGGDYFIGNIASGQFETIFPPRFARRLFLKFMKHLTDNGKEIILLSGDHEWFSRSLADFDIISDVAEKLKKTYLGAGGIVYIKTPGYTYRDVVRHRYRYHSSDNPGHPCRKYLQREDSEADIVCIAHNHINYIGHEEFQRKDRVIIRSGTYKVSDRYMQKRSYLPKESAANIPVVLLNTKRREMRQAFSIEEAKDLLRFLNKE